MLLQGVHQLGRILCSVRGQVTHHHKSALLGEIHEKAVTHVLDEYGFEFQYPVVSTCVLLVVDIVHVRGNQ